MMLQKENAVKKYKYLNCVYNDWWLALPLKHVYDVSYWTKNLKLYHQN